MVSKNIGTEIDRKYAAITALPMLLYGFLVAAIAVFLSILGGPSQIVHLADGPVLHNSALVIGAITLLCLVSAAVCVFFRCFPMWSYTWVGAGITGLMVVFALVVEDRDFVISPVVDITALGLFWLSALVTYAAAAVCGWRHAGLYCMGACGTLGLSLCFFGVAGPFKVNLGTLAAVLGFFEAFLVYQYIRRSRRIKLVFLMIMAIINGGIAWTIESIFRSLYPARDLSQFGYLLVLLTIILFGGTLLGLPLEYINRLFKRRRGSV